MELIQHVNGAWVPTSRATLSVFDVAVLRGYGIFDYLRTYGRKPFTLSAHLDRLFRSAGYISLKVPKTKEEITGIILEGIQKNATVKELDIRIVVTGGVGPNSITPGNSSLLVLFGEAMEYPAQYYTKGVKIITETMIRQFPQAKTINYIMAIPALTRARAIDAVEVVYVGGDTTIYEGTTSNFFTVIDGKLVTPKDDVLIGITRTLVLDLAKKLDIPAKERRMTVSELSSASEACITSSSKEIMPVIMINDVPVGNGLVGPVTKRLIDAFDELKTSGMV